VYSVLQHDYFVQRNYYFIIFCDKIEIGK
jgi:hypothetical protein